jgi:hypothetical protein
VIFAPATFSAITLNHLEAATYRAFFFNPSDGSEVPIGNVTPDSNGSWKPPEIPIFRDWVVVLENKA